MRATFEIDPPEWAEALAVLESTSLDDGPEAVRARVEAIEGMRVTLDFPALDEPVGVGALLSCLVGEWADRADVRRVRLVDVEWPAWLPGPRHDAPARPLVGAIVKPALGLSVAEAAETARTLARGGAELVKDDELLTDPSWCPLLERVRAIGGDAPYAPNVTGPTEMLLERAAACVDAGASALMLNLFVQGVDALRALRDADFGVPLFAHRVGAAFLARGERVAVASRVLAELTRLCGADYVQVGAFTERVHDSADDVRAQIDACRSPLGSVPRPVAVVGGGVGPDNAADQLRQAGTRDGVMLLLGSAAYLDPDGLEHAVAKTVAACAS
jgi:ribulose 1,5-bisphosphate carboxylase large subunit-like protein